MSETGEKPDELWLFSWKDGKGSVAGFHQRRLVMDVGPVKIFGGLVHVFCMSDACHECHACHAYKSV